MISGFLLRGLPASFVLPLSSMVCPCRSRPRRFVDRGPRSPSASRDPSSSDAITNPRHCEYGPRRRNGTRRRLRGGFIDTVGKSRAVAIEPGCIPSRRAAVVEGTAPLPECAYRCACRPVQRDEAVRFEHLRRRGTRDEGDESGRPGLRGSGERHGIDDRRVGVGGKHVDDADVPVDQRVGLVNDAQRRFAAIHERQRGANAVGTDDPILDLLPDPSFVSAASA